MTARVIPHDKVPAIYSDVLEAFPDAVIVKDKDGVLRFKQNELLRHVTDTSLDLNALSVAFENGEFSGDEYMRFYQDIGYSLCGFCECFPESTSPKRRKAFKKALRAARLERK